MKDRAYYLGVLGVSSGATAEETRLAYLDLVKVWHPDRFFSRFKATAESAGETRRHK
jgi:curved DNA-binding protein CbpA